MKDNTIVYGLILIFLVIVIMLSYNERKEYEIQMNNYPVYQNPSRYNYFWWPYYYGAGYGSWFYNKPRYDFHDRPHGDYHDRHDDKFPKPVKPHLPVIPSSGGTYTNPKVDITPQPTFKSISMEHALPTSQSFTPSLMR